MDQAASPRHAPRRSGRAARASLTPDEIVDAAIEMLEADGIDGFSMRGLAGRLGVNPMTLYLRFESRDDLLDGVTAKVFGDMEPPTLGEGSWDDRAVALAEAVCRQLGACRHLLPLVRASNRLAPMMFRTADVGLGLMRELGLDDDAAVEAFRVLFWHAVGFALVHDHMAVQAGATDQAPGDRYRVMLSDMPDATLPVLVPLLPHFSAVDPDELFRLATKLLVLGLRAHYARAGA